MDIAAFNALPPDAAVDAVRVCAEVPAWIASIVSGRPYESVGTLLAFAESESRDWSDAEIDQALAQHPRIGERASATTAESALSASEQSGINGSGAALAEANRTYEETFGRIFLIRAAGRTADDVLEQLTQRLDNDPAEETVVVAGELREIALRRLEGMMTA